MLFDFFTGKLDDMFPVWMLCVVAALLVSVILNVILICVLCKTAKRIDLHPGGTINFCLPKKSAVCCFFHDERRKG